MVHLERRNGKYCVVEPSGKVVPSGCYDTKGKALARLRAINANTKKARGFSVKEIDGVWHWLGIVSNNWLDRHGQIITSKAHQAFVDLIDSGRFKEIILNSYLGEVPYFKEVAERGMPDLWFWHIPVPIGRTEVVGYHESGYLWAAGKQIEGEPYTRIFKTIAGAEHEYGMSHAIPNEFIHFEGWGEVLVDSYVDIEFTALPWTEAANLGTGMVLNAKEAGFMIPNKKQEYIESKFGKETLQHFNEMLEELEQFALDVEIPRKENQMEEKEVVDQAEEIEAEAQEVEVEESPVTDAASDEETVQQESEDQTEEEDAGTGMAIDPAEFTIPPNFKEFANEIAVGMKDVLAEMQKSFNAQTTKLAEQVSEIAGKIEKLEAAEEKRLEKEAREVAAETPPASLSQWLYGSVVGKDSVRVDYNDDRELFNQSKEAERVPQQNNVAGLPPVIANFVSQQQRRS